MVVGAVSHMPGLAWEAGLLGGWMLIGLIGVIGEECASLWPQCLSSLGTRTCNLFLAGGAGPLVVVALGRVVAHQACGGGNELH